MFGNRFNSEGRNSVFSTERRCLVTSTVTQEGRAYGVFNGGVVFSDRFIRYVREESMVFLKERRCLPTGCYVRNGLWHF